MREDFAQKISLASTLGAPRMAPVHLCSTGRGFIDPSGQRQKGPASGRTRHQYRQAVFPGRWRSSNFAEQQSNRQSNGQGQGDRWAACAPRPTAFNRHTSRRYQKTENFFNRVIDYWKNSIVRWQVVHQLARMAIAALSGRLAKPANLFNQQVNLLLLANDDLV